MSDSLRSVLGNGGHLLATFVMIPRTEIVEMLGVAGFQTVVIDLEHGPIGLPDLLALSMASRAAGVYSIARLGSAAPNEIGAALDAGVDGVMVPHVGSGAAAKSAVAASRFPPEGVRSLNPYVRGNQYRGDGEGQLDLANSRAAVLAMIEGDDAIDELDEILAVPGLDAIFVGPVDLSGQLGYPGESEHPKVVEAIESIFERAETAGRAAGVYASTPESAIRWFERGASLVALSADVAMALGGFTSTRAGVGSDQAPPG